MALGIMECQFQKDLKDKSLELHSIPVFIHGHNSQIYNCSYGKTNFHLISRYNRMYYDTISRSPFRSKAHTVPVSHPFSSIKLHYGKIFSVGLIRCHRESLSPASCSHHGQSCKFPAVAIQSWPGKTLASSCRGSFVCPCLDSINPATIALPQSSQGRATEAPGQLLKPIPQ